MSNTRIYRIWKGMRNRCFNKKGKDYKHYGGRGIKICDKWMKFENFYRDMGEIPENKTLDRKDNNKNYCKENCHYATRKQQANNRRSNVLITYNGKTQNVMQWSKELNLSFEALYKRARREQIIIR